ncbi:MAG: methylaspartate mutase accessory protein GlmL [Oscillospiraceae bacterium]|nr:methylaspartate mutase accessory protein GlmL [Oscillospiraceae bacterium]
MEAVLLIDFGSTYTKVTAVDIGQQRLIGSASSRTTVETDVADGLASALAEMEKQTGRLEFSKRLACSSAAGGLRMVACGLVPELTAKAASLASLGAGAKVVRVYSYYITESDAMEIETISPDILLLTGGTDGGNTECIVNNAAVLADMSADFPIIIAGNRSCSSQVMRILKHRQAYLCDNVMPSLDTLNIEPARQMIREIFLQRIVHAKGLSHTGQLLDGILMPTPAAVLDGVELLANGVGEEPGIGELLAVDVGGATTDVFSVATGSPHNAEVIYKGLPEPFIKRTVEGDIGMRRSAPGIVEAVGISRVAKLAGLSEETTRNHLDRLATHSDALPQNPESKALDFALAALAVETATLRHAGTLTETYTAAGRAYIQTGKDLTYIDKLVMTGGALLHSERQEELASFAMRSDLYPQSLRPKQAELFVDSRYILSAMGLLSSYEPRTALNILKTNLNSPSSDNL